MDVLIILLLAFAALFVPRLFGKDRLGNWRKGQIAMGIMLLCTGAAHFTNSADMAAMLPPVIPYHFHLPLVYLTGIIELVFAASFLLNRFLYPAALFYMVFLVLVLPANIYGALHGANVGGAPMSANYLWFRIPLQLFFIAWTWYCCLKGFPAQPAAFKTGK